MIMAEKPTFINHPEEILHGSIVITSLLRPQTEKQIRKPILLMVQFHQQHDNGGTLNYTYYPDRQVKTITAPGSITTSMQYDVAGNQTQLTDPSAGTITYTYDGFRQLTSQQNARSQTTQLTYYSDGRINQKISSAEGTTTYYYNLNAQITSILNSTTNIKKRFVYDHFGRDSIMVDSIPGTTKFTTKYSFDSYGRLDTITHPSGIVETKTYNQRGYLSVISAGGASRWTVTRDECVSTGHLGYFRKQSEYDNRI